MKNHKFDVDYKCMSMRMTMSCLLMRSGKMQTPKIPRFSGSENILCRIFRFLDCGPYDIGIESQLQRDFFLKFLIYPAFQTIFNINHIDEEAFNNHD